jgi:phosphate transport system substrate-binding protein
MLNRLALASLSLWVLWIATPLAAQPADTIQGAGATFPSKVYDRWADRFASTTGEAVKYKGTGSGDGIKQITARAVDFGGTDSPLSREELQKRKLVQMPMLIGGIVPVVNLGGVASNRLILSPAVLADIMAARIESWNDARIAELNPGLVLPARAILRIVRSDRSGTTEGYTRYLSEVSAPFAKGVGSSQLPEWPGVVTKADGNDGMVRALKATEGSIAYVSYDRVVRDELVAVRLRNAANQVVAASEAGFRAAIRDSDLYRTGDDLASLMNRADPQAWPITLTSFALVDLEPADAERAGRTMRFLYWCFMRGDDLTRGTGFAPLPIAMQARLAARFAQVRAKDGKPLRYTVF